MHEELLKLELELDEVEEEAVAPPVLLVTPTFDVTLLVLLDVPTLEKDDVIMDELLLIPAVEETVALLFREQSLLSNVGVQNNWTSKQNKTNRLIILITLVQKL